MTTTELLYSFGALLVSAGVLLLARVLYAKLAAYDVDGQLTEADNPAVGTAMFGFLGGITAVLVALLSTEAAQGLTSEGMQWDLFELAIYGILAIVLLKIAGWINDKFILKGFENQKELVDDRNVGVGAVLGGSYLASGLILAGSLTGRVDDAVLTEGSKWAQLGQEMGIALAFFVIGQVALILFALLYQVVQSQDVLHEIERDYEIDGQFFGGNAAAGMAFGGNLLAFSLVLYAGASADFTSWAENLAAFGVASLVGLVLLPTWRLFVDHIMLPKADLAKEIYEDRNVNAALLETVCVLALALIIVMVFPDLNVA
jgi:uncharacterized membrane protein YjfL (UPF0719 family)